MGQKKTMTVEALKHKDRHTNIPTALPEQMRTLAAHIQTAGIPLDLASITKAFKGARKPKVQEILDALTDLGRLTQPDAAHWQG